MDRKEVPEGFMEILNQNKKLIEHLEREENAERVETIDAIINRMKVDREKTQLEKNRFINDIKSGLGETIKTNPNQVQYVKRPWYHKLTKFINNVFKKI